MKRALALLLVVSCSPPEAQVAPHEVEVARVEPSSAADATAAPDATAPASSEPPPIVVPAGSGPNGCLRETEYADLVRRVEERNDAVFRAAVARAGMTVVELAKHTWFTTEGRGGPPPNPVVEREVGGRKARLVLIGSVAKPCGRPIEEGFHFGRAGAKVVQIERTVTTRRVEVPVCPATTCPPPPAPCGGALQVVGLGFELPAGASYGGKVEVHVTADWVQPLPSAAPGIVCPMPPKPPG